ncbi:MAG: hypothetical protein R3D00_03115 [Bacteroidia bacterium]
MPRLHLFEFEDLSWFPSLIRNYMTDFLQFVVNKFNFYGGIIPLLKKGLTHSGGTTVIDLASGGSGPWLRLAPELKKEIPSLHIVLTDYYPNIPAFEKTVAEGNGLFSYEKSSVNALDVPARLKGLRTQFLSFHHFRPEDAQKILQNAVNSGMPIGIFEAQKRDVKHFIQFFFSPINVILVTPFLRPFSFLRLIFTYLIPLVPLFVWWDGLVSVLRTYSIAEMKDMISRLDKSDSFDWEVGESRTGQVTNLYILGYPK